VKGAKQFGFGKKTGIDIPGEASGRIADRKWKLDYWNAMKGYYCRIDKKNKTGKRDFLHVFAHEFCLEGNRYRQSDAVNYSIGQGDTMVTPLQLARAYAALANGGTLYAPRVAKAVVGADGKVIKRIKPVVEGRVPSTKAALRYVDEALQGTPKVGTLAWKFGGFPLDQVKVRGKTGSAEVYGKQSTSWVATYNEDYVVVMMVTQAGTGSGTSGEPVRRMWEALYGIDGETVNPAKAVIPGAEPPKRLPTFTADGSILPPSTRPRNAQGGTR
jgi:penicillin-binding protein 2